MIYTLQNGKIRDDGKKLRVDTCSDSVVLASLQIARQQYGDTLDIQGNMAFKQRAAELNISQNLGLKLSDPWMEKFNPAFVERLKTDSEQYIHNKNKLPEKIIKSENDKSQIIRSGNPGQQDKQMDK